MHKTDFVCYELIDAEYMCYSKIIGNMKLLQSAKLGASCSQQVLRYCELFQALEFVQIHNMMCHMQNWSVIKIS
jgi:hypothetical protein